MLRAMRIASTIFLLCMLWAATAHADRGSSPYKVYPWPEFGASVAVLASSVLVPKIWIERPLNSPPCGHCDPMSMNGFDRFATRQYAPGARLASDISLGIALASPYAMSALEDPGAGFVHDAVVYTETLALTLLATQVAKYTALRSRPFTYNPDAPLEEKLRYDAQLSFFSGHTAIAFSMCTAAAMTYSLRHPTSPERWGVSAAALAVASFTGFSRIISGKHFLSDVLLGAAVGTTIGLLVPYLHRPDTSSAAPPLTASPLYHLTGSW